MQPFIDDSPSDILEHLQGELPVKLISTPRRNFKTCHAHERVSEVIRGNTEDYDFLPVLKSLSEGKSATIIGLLKISSPTNASSVVQDIMSPLSEENLIGADASIMDFLRGADRQPCRLIVAGPEITGLVSLSDIQRLPVRAALFAMITHLEMTIADAIRRVYKGNDWMTKLSPNRVSKLHEEIERSVSDDCLVEELLFTQFADKVTIITKSEAFHESKSRFSEQMKAVHGLRDHLAHANNFASTHETSVGVCRTVRVIDQWIDRLKLWPG
jgi:hypothetical protein